MNMTGIKRLQRSRAFIVQKINQNTNLSQNIRIKIIDFYERFVF